MRKPIHPKAVSLIAGAACLLSAAIQPVTAGTSGPAYNYSITPCRILDTRTASGVYAGKMAPGESMSIRTSNVSGTIVVQGGSGSGCPDIPSDATGLFLNVIAVAGSGSFNNHVGIGPWGGTGALGTAINYTPGVYATNNGMFVGTCYGQWLYGFAPFPGNCDQDLMIENGPGASAHIVIDVTGFSRNY